MEEIFETLYNARRMVAGVEDEARNEAEAERFERVFNDLSDLLAAYAETLGLERY